LLEATGVGLAPVPGKAESVGPINIPIPVGARSAFFTPDQIRGLEAIDKKYGPQVVYVQWHVDPIPSPLPSKLDGQ
jgi:hypothetical protein